MSAEGVSELWRASCLRNDPFREIAHSDGNAVALPDSGCVHERGEVQDATVRLGIRQPLLLVYNVLVLGECLPGASESVSGRNLARGSGAGARTSAAVFQSWASEGGKLR